MLDYIEAVSKIRGFGVFAAAKPPQTPQLTIFEMTTRNIECFSVQVIG